VDGLEAVHVAYCWWGGQYTWRTAGGRAVHVASLLVLQDKRKQPELDFTCF